jgi:predicted acylesterase/phospholipase RssA
MVALQTAAGTSRKKAFEGEYFWDGWLVSNAPLQWVLDTRPRQDTLALPYTALMRSVSFDAASKAVTKLPGKCVFGGISGE